LGTRKALFPILSEFSRSTSPPYGFRVVSLNPHRAVVEAAFGQIVVVKRIRLALAGDRLGAQSQRTDRVVGASATA